MRSSIRTRIILLVAITQIALTAGGAVVAFLTLRQSLITSMDAALRGRALAVAALVRYSEDSQHSLIFDNSAVPQALYPPLPDYFEVRASPGGVIASSPRSIDPSDRYRTMALHDVPIMDVEDGAPPVLLDVTYAAPTAPMRRQLLRASLTIVLGGLGFLVAALIISGIGIQRSLSPVNQLADAASRISAGKWQFRPPASARRIVELEPLIKALDDAVDRLRHSFEQQTDFLTNAAHELKTPVAVLKSTIQMLTQRQRSSEEYRAGMQDMLGDVARIERLLTRIMRLARAEQSDPDGVRLVDVAETCKAAAAQVQRLAESCGITIDISTNRAIQVAADGEDLTLIWINLLENAIRYACSKVVLTIGLAPEGGVEVSVADDGPGIPPEDIARIFERFHRGDPSRSRDTGGAGLGLAISKALAEAYRGSISVSAVPGEGATFRVRLPVAEPTPAAV